MGQLPFPRFLQRETRAPSQPPDDAGSVTGITFPAVLCAESKIGMVTRLHRRPSARYEVTRSHSESCPEFRAAPPMWESGDLGRLSQGHGVGLHRAFAWHSGSALNPLVDPKSFARS